MIIIKPQGVSIIFANGIKIEITILYISTPAISTSPQVTHIIIAIGSIESNHALTKSGITESSLKKENLPNNPIINLTKIPATMATNIPPAPSASCPKPIVPSATTCGVMMIKKVTHLIKQL